MMGSAGFPPPPAGEEVLLIQEKLDGIKSRYAEMTAGSSRALRTLEQALQLSTRFAAAHEDVSRWLDGVEAELNNMEPDASPAYQERQKVGGVIAFGLHFTFRQGCILERCIAAWGYDKSQYYD